MSVNDQMVQDIVKEVMAKMQLQSEVSGCHGVFKDMNEAIEAVAVEEKPIDRAYNAKGQKRQTHLEVMGGALLMQFAVAEYPIL